jgi:hypothetical protein
VQKERGGSHIIKKMLCVSSFIENETLIGSSLREYFISLFPRMSCHKKYFKAVNETAPKIHDFILEFHNTKFYVVLLVIYMMK